MNANKIIYPILLLLFNLFGIAVCAQKITYTEPDREDSRGMSFEIIGKINGNYLIYKTIRNEHVISVYDNDMKLVERNRLSIIPDKVLNVDFIAYPDFCYMIYQYQRRSILNCMAVKFDSKGHQVGEPKLLDTTSIGFFSENKIYNTVFSEDKQKIVVYKIQKRNEKFHYTTLLFNSNLELQRKSRMVVAYDDRRNYMSDFFVDNEGNFVFASGLKIGSRDYINKLTLITKPANADSFAFHEMNIGKLLLDEIKLKVDNINKRYLINSFYYPGRRTDIEGLYSALWDTKTNRQTVMSEQLLSDTARREAKTEGSLKMAFNNFFIKDVILKRDGGYLLVGEDYYTQSRSNQWNRMDYLYGSPYSVYDYYQPGYYNPYRYRNMYNSNNQNRYYYDNLLVLSLNKDGVTEWSRVIHKTQFDDESDKFLSFYLFNAAGDLHFLYNEMDRRNKILNDQSLEPNGNITRNPTLKSLDRGYDFMPVYAKQVGARQLIVPCDYRNFICFAKIEY